MRVRRLSKADIRRELDELERKHQMSTPAFMQAYCGGALGHDRDFVRWLGLWRMMHRREGPALSQDSGIHATKNKDAI